MSHPTPLADDLADCATAVEAGGLLYNAGRLTALVVRVAELERFHAAVTADALEEELRQPGAMPTAHSDFLDHFNRSWGLRPC